MNGCESCRALSSCCPVQKMAVPQVIPWCFRDATGGNCILLSEEEAEGYWGPDVFLTTGRFPVREARFILLGLILLLAASCLSYGYSGMQLQVKALGRAPSAILTMVGHWWQATACEVVVVHVGDREL